MPLALVPSVWSPGLELQLLGFLALFWVLEDFLWFALNPAFGIGRFRPERAWWHAGAWLGPMPRAYWIGIPAGLVLYVAGRALGA